jgi:hypothetical protein
MRKCPDCEKENRSESLFCEHCGHSLLPPDPESVKWPIATHREHHEKIEGIDFYQLAEKARALKLDRRFKLHPVERAALLLLVNWLILVLIYEIVRYFFVR